MRNWFSDPMECETKLEDILKKAENGEFHEWKFKPIMSRETGYEDVIEKLKSYTADEYNSYEAGYKKAKEAGDEKEAEKYKNEMDRMVSEVLQIYREKNIFPIQYYSELEAHAEVAKCIDYEAKFDGNTVSCGAGVGTGLCRWLFPNIFDTPSAHDLNKKDAETQYKKFLNDEYLGRAIRFCFSYKGGCPVPTAVEGGLRLVGSAPSNFRPMNAKAVYERFCPKGGVIYDYCCVDEETEYFNGYEWKSISQYEDGDMVLQYNEDGTAELVKPLEYIHYESDDVFYEYEDPSISVCQTGNHDVVHIKDGKLLKEKQYELLKKNIFVPVTCLLDGDVTISRKKLKDIIWEVENALYGVYPKEFYRLSLQSKRDFADLIKEYVEGDDGGFFYGNTMYQNYSIISFIIHTSGWGTVSECGDGMAIWEGSKTANIDCESYEYNYEEVYKKDKYCFVVPSHMLVLKRRGNIYITGNCGFGGRMLGALSSKNNYKYVGTDPCTETFYHLNQLGELIESVTGREDSYELHCCGSEDFVGPKNSIDFAFSSPPYFDLEVYSDEETQCYNKFPVLEDWLEGYVRATIRNIKTMLKPGCVYAVNIADFNIKGGSTVAYVDEWIRISKEEGLPLYDNVYLGVTARAGTKLQDSHELKKENILIFKKPLW